MASRGGVCASRAGVMGGGISSGGWLGGKNRQERVFPSATRLWEMAGGEQR